MSADQNLPARTERKASPIRPAAPDIPEPSALLRKALDVMLNPMVEVPHSDGSNHLSARALPAASPGSTAARSPCALRSR